MQVNSAGTYQVRARTYAPTYGDDSYWLKIDSGSQVYWDLPVGGSYLESTARAATT